MSSTNNMPKNTTSNTTNTYATENNLSASGTQGVTLLGNSGPTALTSNTTNNTATLSNSNNTSTSSSYTYSPTSKVVTSNSNNYTGGGNTTNSNNVYVDEGAVLAGTELGHAAIASNAGLSEALSKDYASELDNASIRSTNLVSDVLTKGFQFLAGENATIANMAVNNATNLSTAYGNYATTLGQISTAQDTSLSSQSTQFTTGAMKIAAVVILGVALIYFASKSA